MSKSDWALSEEWRKIGERIASGAERDYIAAACLSLIAALGDSDDHVESQKVQEEALVIMRERLLEISKWKDIARKVVRLECPRCKEALSIPDPVDVRFT